MIRSGARQSVPSPSGRWDSSIDFQPIEIPSLIMNQTRLSHCPITKCSGQWYSLDLDQENAAMRLLVDADHW